MASLRPLLLVLVEEIASHLNAGYTLRTNHTYYRAMKGPIIALQRTKVAKPSAVPRQVRFNPPK